MTTPVRRVLSIDGGGIKGALPAAFLARIEEATGKRIVEQFDLIAGTSTGGIIAIGLGLGMSAREILELYVKRGQEIFSNAGDKSLLDRLTPDVVRRRTEVKYDPASLQSVLEGCWGSRMLGESQARLVIPAYHPTQRGVYVFKTAHHPRFQMDWKCPAVDVAMATAAAPTYFPAHMIASGEILIDGGIWANNPVAVAATEAVSVLGWPAESVRILSLGCTEADYSVPHETGELQLALELADLFMQCQSQGATGMAQLLIGHSQAGARFHRYQPVVPHKTFALDGVAQVAELVSLGQAEARKALPKVTEVFFGEPAHRFVPVYGGAGVDVRADAEERQALVK